MKKAHVLPNMKHDKIYFKSGKAWSTRVIYLSLFDWCRGLNYIVLYVQSVSY